MQVPRSGTDRRRCAALQLADAPAVSGNAWNPATLSSAACRTWVGGRFCQAGGNESRGGPLR